MEGLTITAFVFGMMRLVALSRVEKLI